MVDLANLTLAYTRRKRFEAKLLANELANIMSGALGGSSQPQRATGNVSSNPDHVHADTMFGEMGIEF